MPPTDLAWSGCLNARDLGGLPTADGGRIRDRALVRTDNLTRLDDAGRGAFEAYAPSRIVDLRFPSEVQDDPHPCADRPAYVHASYLDPEILRDAELSRIRVRLPLAATYNRLLDTSLPFVAASVRAVLEAPDGPVVVHCYSGKDRTGVLVALLLDLAGVPREDIATDYALTEVRLDSLAFLERFEGTAAERADAVWEWRTLPGTMLAVLDHVDNEYGGTRALLLRIGFSDEELDRLVARLVEPAG